MKIRFTNEVTTEFVLILLCEEPGSERIVNEAEAKEKYTKEALAGFAYENDTERAKNVCLECWTQAFHFLEYRRETVAGGVKEGCGWYCGCAAKRKSRIVLEPNEEGYQWREGREGGVGIVMG